MRLQKGAVLFYEGEICKEILYLLQGKIRLCVIGEGTSEIPLYDFCGGEQCVVNIASAISQTPAVATAEAITQISGWLIPASVIQELIVRKRVSKDDLFAIYAALRRAYDANRGY